MLLPRKPFLLTLLPPPSISHHRRVSKLQEGGGGVLVDSLCGCGITRGHGWQTRLVRILFPKCGEDRFSSPRGWAATSGGNGNEGMMPCKPSPPPPRPPPITSGIGLVDRMCVAASAETNGRIRIWLKILWSLGKNYFLFLSRLLYIISSYLFGVLCTRCVYRDGEIRFNKAIFKANVIKMRMNNILLYVYT